MAHARQRRQAGLHGRAQQHAGVDRGAEAVDARRAGDRARASARPSSNGTAEQVLALLAAERRHERAATRDRVALIEFPADDPQRALRFWSGLLGVALEPRTEGEGSGWQSRSTVPPVGIHERGRGPGDSFSLPYFAVDDLPAGAGAGRGARRQQSSIPASRGRSARTPRAVRSVSRADCWFPATLFGVARTHLWGRRARRGHRAWKSRWVWGSGQGRAGERFTNCARFVMRRACVGEERPALVRDLYGAPSSRDELGGL